MPGDIEAMPLEVPTEYDSDASVWVDGTQPQELPMIQCSPAFYTYLGGPSLRKNAHLMSWVQDPDFEDRARKYVTASLIQTSVATTTRRVELRPTTLARYSVSVKMTLSLARDGDARAQTPPGPPPPTTLGSSLDISRDSSASSDDDSSLVDDNFIVKIVCSEMHFKRRTMAAPRRRRARTLAVEGQRPSAVGGITAVLLRGAVSL